MAYKILVISSLYPNAAQPRHGIFIEHRLRHFIRESNAETRVIAPVPWFPSNNRFFPGYSVYARAPKAGRRNDISILYPRFPVIPKIGMSLAPFLLSITLIRTASRMIREGFDFDLIDAYYSFPDGVAAALTALHFKKPFIINALGSDINTLSEFIFPRHMIKWSADKAAHLSTVSQALKSRLEELGVNGNKISVVRHGVDLNIFYPSPDRTALRARLNLNRFTLLSVGNLIELKGHHIAINALKSLPDMELLIAGHGPYMEFLVKEAKLCGVDNRVRFLGLLDQSTLREYYSASDVLVLPSRSEGIPNVLLESMACGTPVIATDVGGVTEVVKSSVAGCLVSERSPESLAFAVKTLSSSYPDRSDTRKFVEQFTWSETSKAHLRMVQNVLGTVPPYH